MFTVSTDETVYAFIKTGHMMEPAMMGEITTGIRNGDNERWYCPNAYNEKGDRAPLKVASINRMKYMVFQLVPQEDHAQVS